MGVEKVLASNLVILLVAMWSPIDFYIFTQPKFQSEKTCVQYVMEHHEALNIHVMQKYGGELKMNTFYCIVSEKLKRVFNRENQPQI